MKQRETNNIIIDRQLYQQGIISSYNGTDYIDNYIKGKQQIKESCCRPILTNEMKQQLNEEIEKAIEEIIKELNIE